MNRNKKFVLNVQLAILGFLKEKEFYGYELKKFMERFMGPFANIKFGSIYYALEKLSADRLVEPVREEKAGAQPERTIYRITDRGRAAFLKMLEESLTALQQVYYLLDVSLFFAGGLDPKRVASLLRHRAERVGEARAALAKIHRSHEGNPIAQLLIEHNSVHLETEVNYLNRVAECFERGDPYAGKTLRQWLDEAPEHAAEGRPQADIV